MNHIYVLLKKSVFVVLIYVMIGSISAQVTWDKYQNNPILKTGDAETWESVVSVIISVVYHDGMYKAWVSGADETDTGRIGYATSEDGIVWTRYENIPVLAEARAYYSGQITNMEAEVYRIAGQDSPLKAEIDTEFEELDRMFTELKADLKDNAANEEVIEAMIQNYRIKLHILEEILIQLKNADEQNIEDDEDKKVLL